MTSPIDRASAAGRVDANGIATLTAEDIGFLGEEDVLELRHVPPAPVPVRPAQRIVPVR